MRETNRSLRVRVPLVAALAAVAVAVTAVAGMAGGATTRRLSISSGGRQAKGGNSFAAETAGKGRFVAYESKAHNLVAGDTNSLSDVFVRDRSLHRTFRVSVSSGEHQANGESHSVDISPNGRYVVFESFATNLAKGDVNGTYDVFLRDRGLGRTFLISVSSSGAHGNFESADPVVSANGRYVAFESAATNLVKGDTNNSVDTFVRDRAAGKTIRVSVSSAERQGNASSSDPAISPNGRFVAFQSLASNLVQGDTANESDVILRDRMLGKTFRMSVSSGGVQGNAGSYSMDVTPDGRYVAFESFADNLTKGDTNHHADVFLRDRSARKTYRLSVSSRERQGNGFSADPSISADGRYVTFESRANNLVSGDTNGATDVFVRDRARGATRRVSVNSSGHQGNAESSDPSISGSGRWIVFESQANNLSSGDTNQRADVFVRGPVG
jgi:Tol biopolymer transport system component